MCVSRSPPQWWPGDHRRGRSRGEATSQGPRRRLRVVGVGDGPHDDRPRRARRHDLAEPGVVVSLVTAPMLSNVKSTWRKRRSVAVPATGDTEVRVTEPPLAT